MPVSRTATTTPRPVARSPGGLGANAVRTRETPLAAVMGVVRRQRGIQTAIDLYVLHVGGGRQLTHERFGLNAVELAGRFQQVRSDGQASAVAQGQRSGSDRALSHFGERAFDFCDARSFRTSCTILDDESVVALPGFQSRGDHLPGQRRTGGANQYRGNQRRKTVEVKRIRSRHTNLHSRCRLRSSSTMRRPGRYRTLANFLAHSRDSPTVYRRDEHLYALATARAALDSDATRRWDVRYRSDANRDEKMEYRRSRATAVVADAMDGRFVPSLEARRMVQSPAHTSATGGIDRAFRQSES